MIRRTCDCGREFVTVPGPAGDSQRRRHQPLVGHSESMSDRITDRIEIVNADCYTLLDAWPSDAALVTDPPYGIGYVSFGGRGVAGPSAFAGDAIAWDAKPFDPFPFLRFATVCLCGANHFAPRLPTVGKWLVWDKRCGVTPERVQADCELAWCNRNGAARVFRHVWDGMIRDSEKGPRVHPMQKPVALLAWTLQACDDEEKGRVTIAPVNTELAIPPRQTVSVDMLMPNKEVDRDE